MRNAILNITKQLLTKTILFCCFICAFVIVTLSGCQENSSSKTIATVDGMKITIGELNDRLNREFNVSTVSASLTPEDYDHLKEEVLNAMIDEKIMLLRAGELSLSVSDAELEKKIGEIEEKRGDETFERIVSAQHVDYKRWKEGLRKRMLLEKLVSSDVNARVTVNENEARTFYNTRRRMYAPEKRAHVAQIVVRDREKAEMILKRLNSGEDFGKVAKVESIGPEAAAGGDLGFVGQGVMPEEIDAAIFSRRTGEISPVIKSPYGYHIFKIMEVRGTKTGWADIKEQVLNDVRKRKEEQEFARWLEALRSKAATRIDRELLKKAVIPLKKEPE